MKVLISAFECNPYGGSDSYVGWSYVKNMAELNEVYVLTRTANKESIENYCGQNEVHLDMMHFIYVEQSSFFTKTLYKLNKYLGFLGSYFIWQRSAYKAAKKLSRDEDIKIAHHISIADFRCAGYLWKLNIPFIFGPVGGGQTTPVCLKDYIVGHEKSEWFRSFMNNITTLAPSYRKALKKASLVYCSNDETLDCVKKRIGSKHWAKIQRMTELCIDEDYLLQREKDNKGKNSIVHIIVSGRLIYRKGVAVLLESVKNLKTEIPYQVDIFGQGDQERLLKEFVTTNNLEKNVVFHGKVDFLEMQEQYRKADIYVLPSLRETTGTSVIEAMANKLPVVSFEQNGVKHLVEHDSGILVALTNKEQIISDLAEALKVLIEDESLRKQFGENGFKKIKQNYTWENRVRMMNSLYMEICEK